MKKEYYGYTTKGNYKRRLLKGIIKEDGLIGMVNWA